MIGDKAGPVFALRTGAATEEDDGGGHDVLAGERAPLDAPPPALPSACASRWRFLSITWTWTPLPRPGAESDVSSSTDERGTDTRPPPTRPHESAFAARLCAAEGSSPPLAPLAERSHAPERDEPPSGAARPVRFCFCASLPRRRAAAARHPELAAGAGGAVRRRAAARGNRRLRPQAEGMGC